MTRRRMMMIAPLLFLWVFLSLSGAVSAIREVYLGRSSRYASQFAVIAVQQLQFRHTTQPMSIHSRPAGLCRITCS